MTRRHRSRLTEVLGVIRASRRRAFMVRRVGNSIQISRHNISPTGAISTRPNAQVTIAEADLVAVLAAARGGAQ